MVFKSVLQNIISSEASYIYVMKMHIDKLVKAVDVIDFSNEKQITEHLIDKGLEIADEVFISSKQDIVINYSNKQSILELEPQIVDSQVKKILNKCWDGLKIEHFELEYFIKHIGTIEGKRAFILLLNEKRKLGEFTLPIEGFAGLGELFNHVLDSLNAEKNFAVARQCIILSQTFFTKDKQYVQSLIISHPLWNSNQFWKDIIEDSIINEINALIECENDISDYDILEGRNKSVIIAALVSYIDIMVSFNKDKKLIIDIAESCKQKYTITDDELPLHFILNISNS